VADEQSTERLEERVAALESKVRLLTLFITLGCGGLVVLVFFPGLWLFLLPMATFALIAGALALLDI